MNVIISGNTDIINLMYMIENKKVSHATFPLDKKLTNTLIKQIKQNLADNFESHKLSIFNYYVQHNDMHMIYNTMYNTLVKLSQMEYEKLLGNKVCGKQLSLKYLKNGLWVSDALDELKNYKLYIKQFKKNQVQHLSVNITTTLNCNARCHYCYEQGVRRDDFEAKYISGVLNFIKQKKGNKPISLNWYGGEPLMNTAVIDSISQQLNKEKIEFDSYLITNGSLINKRMVKTKFPKWHIADVQVTLDGTEKVYEARKAYVNNGRGIFKRILNKIDMMALEGVRVHIRLNIDQDNMEDILDLLNILQKRFADYANVTYYPAFLTGIGNTLKEADKILFVNKMFGIIADPNKMNIGSRMYSLPKVRACMRSDPRSFTVDVHGNIYTCEHMVGQTEKAIGTIDNLLEDVNQKRSNTRLRRKCAKCIFLPKCMGGCEANLESKDELCLIEKYMIQAYLDYMCE